MNTEFENMTRRKMLVEYTKTIMPQVDVDILYKEIIKMQWTPTAVELIEEIKS